MRRTRGSAESNLSPDIRRAAKILLVTGRTMDRLQAKRSLKQDCDQFPSESLELSGNPVTSVVVDGCIRH